MSNHEKPQVTEGDDDDVSSPHVPRIEPVEDDEQY
jgi:hypothetical protein